MSTPTNPKPGAGNALESTFLGVAPVASEPPSPPSTPPLTPPSAPASSSASSGSAIIAAPTISVSGDRKAHQPVAAVAPAAPAGLEPALRPTALQGGWQSAGVARPQSPDQTAPHGTPGAWPVPPAHGAAASPLPQPAPAQPAQAAATAGGGLQHTALASDYLRAAREAALGGAMVPVAPRAITPAAPSIENLTARAPQFPPPLAPASTPPATAALSATAAPPATAALSEPEPLPLQQRTYQSPVAYAPEPELLNGPRSIGTQASIAPPLHPTPAPAAMPAVHAAAQAAAHPPALSPPAHAGMIAAPAPVRPLAPSPLAGTMLDRAPSLPGSALGPPAIAPSVPSVAHSASPGVASRFEQVPSARSSLAQQQTGFGLHIPIDQSASDWGRMSLPPSGAARRKDKPRSPLRWIVLATLAVAAIGVAAFGKQLISRVTAMRTDRIEQALAADERESPKQTTLTNLPGTSPAAAPGATPPAPIPPAPIPPAPAAPAVAAASAAPAAAPAALPSVRVSEGKAEPLDPAAARAAEAARKEAEAAASPESKLAAQAARNVLAARYTDALPLYRQLQQSYPQNTAYAAMVRVLEQKTAPVAHGAQP